MLVACGQLLGNEILPLDEMLAGNGLIICLFFPVYKTSDSTLNSWPRLPDLRPRELRSDDHGYTSPPRSPRVVLYVLIGGMHGGL